MQHRRAFLVSASSMVLTLGLARKSLADKAAAEIEAPAVAAMGSEVTVKIHVRHDGNSFLHYVDWVSVKVNGEEKKRWEYSAWDRPEDGNFTRELKLKVDGPLEIEAQANCNVHGSANLAIHTVEPEKGEGK